jgi:hypothetical protein
MCLRSHFTTNEPAVYNWYLKFISRTLRFFAFNWSCMISTFTLSKGRLNLFFCFGLKAAHLFVHWSNFRSKILTKVHRTILSEFSKLQDFLSKGIDFWFRHHCKLECFLKFSFQWEMKCILWLSVHIFIFPFYVFFLGKQANDHYHPSNLHRKIFRMFRSSYFRNLWS